MGLTELVQRIRFKSIMTGAELEKRIELRSNNPKCRST